MTEFRVAVIAEALSTDQALNQPLQRNNRNVRSHTFQFLSDDVTARSNLHLECLSKIDITLFHMVFASFCYQLFVLALFVFPLN